MNQEQIQWIVEFTIKRDKLHEFKRLVDEITGIVKEQESGTRGYQWYFDDEETKCIITESYSSPEAALAHLNGEGVTKILPKLLEVSDITRLELYGDPGEEVQKRLAKFGVRSFHFFVGFKR